MIEAKGTKTAPQPANAAERYVLKNEDEKSRTPFAIAALLTGLALYLKSMFSGSSEAGSGPFGQQTGKSALEPDPNFSASSTSADEASDRPGGTVLGPIGSASASLGRIEAAGYLAIDAAFYTDFLPPEAPLDWQAALLPPRPIAANDNGGTPAIGRTQPAVSVPGGVGPGTDNPDHDDEEPIDGGPDDQEPPDGSPDTCGEDEDESDCQQICDDDDDDPETANRAPRLSGPVYLADVPGCATLAIGLADLLRNAYDPDGDVLSVSNLTISSGSLSVTPAGWHFIAEPLAYGPVTLTYQISDGAFFVEQVAHFSVVEHKLIKGGDGDDLLLGTLCDDEIHGGAGDDNIDARGGDDIIVGGNGNDNIVAGDGNDTIFAGSGHDIVFAGAGNDVVYGGSGNDRIFGEAGDDILFGEEGDDFLSGGEGNDILFGGSGNDVLDGGEGDDLLDGGEGDDHLIGGEGNDTILDGSGRDIVEAGAGDDHVIAALDGDDDVFDGGEGCDVLDYSEASQSLTLDLNNGNVSGIEVGNDCISGFESIIGGQGDDHFIAGGESAVLTGGGGDDLFEFRLPEVPSTDAIEKTVYEILDFKVGDLIRMSKYDLFEEVFDEFEDRFEELYGDDVDDDDVPIRFRHERYEEKDRTVIEADLNSDTVYETMIWLEGHRVLVTIEHA